MKLSAVYLTLVLAAAVHANSVKDWLVADVKQFLADTGLTLSPDSDEQRLRRAASAKWDELKLGYDTYTSAAAATGRLWVQQAKQAVFGAPPPHQQAWNYLFGTTTTSDWLFDTWLVDQLKRYLDTNKVTTKAAATKDELVEQAKASYHLLAAKYKGSEIIPGNWVYELWGVEDLEGWLKARGIEAKKSAENLRDELVKQVREYLYLALAEVRDAKKELFDLLDLPLQEEVVDKAGAVKQLFVEQWLELQLQEWLLWHGVDTAALAALKDAEQRKQALQKQVQEHSKELASDIKLWGEQAAASALPFLSKATAAVQDAINDTFLVGVDRWLRSRLREFLKARDIPVPYFATRLDLVALVRRHALLPLVVAALQLWDSTVGTARDTVGKAADTVGKALASIQRLFDGWLAELLRDYLVLYGYSTKATATYTKDQLAALAQRNTQWLVGDVTLSDYLTGRSAPWYTRAYNYLAGLTPKLEL